MNKVILYAAALIFGAGCSKNDSGIVRPHIKRVSPVFAVSEQTTPFSGYLTIYPCKANSAIYFGNYKTGLPIITQQFGYYRIENGAALPDADSPLLLPTGSYNLVYWGEIASPDAGRLPSTITYPNVSVGSDLSEQYIALTPYRTGGTLYRPAPNLSFAVKETSIGTENISAVLNRAVAGLQITIRNEDGSPFDKSIDSLELQLHGIPMHLNLFTAQPSGPGVTVLVPLTFAAGRLEAQNRTDMLFPTGTAPQATIVITLADGDVRTYETTLSNPLKANNKLSLSVNLGKIFDTPEPGKGFEVKNWNESNETINTGNLEE